jgi:hypothetical protein
MNSSRIFSMRCIAFAAVFLCMQIAFGQIASDKKIASVRVPIFHETMLHFHPDSANKYAEEGAIVSDNGRVQTKTVELPAVGKPYRIIAHIELIPIPKDDRSVCDRWDRAGNLRLVTPNKPDLEIMRFMTSYGGRTEHHMDVSYLAPLLQGKCTFRAYVDTWVSPAWRMNAELEFVPDTSYANADWVMPVYYTDSFTRQEMPDGVSAAVEIPAGMQRVSLIYLSTGHCTDGTDADEFISKANVISVDNDVVMRFHPWRTDCRKNREINPYTSHWTDGTWSSDYSRSGWCPGCEVIPQEFDFTDHLTAGKHTIKFLIENMRAKDEKGNFGVWKVSGYLVGWKTMPELWKN